MDIIFDGDDVPKPSLPPLDEFASEDDVSLFIYDRRSKFFSDFDSSDSFLQCISGVIFLLHFESAHFNGPFKEI